MDQPKERQQWDKLVSELATEIKIMQPIRHQASRILYQMKVHLQLHGLDKGRGGRWETALRDLEIEKSTARDWVVKYQLAENLPSDKCFFQAEVRRVRRTRYSHKYGKNKGAFPALFRRREVEETDARVDPAPDDKQDKSPEQRQAVECIFVLSLSEKLMFMEAVTKLGELRSTQAMYKAIIHEADMDQKGAGA